MRSYSLLGRYPSEFFQLAFFKLQGLREPLFKFCVPTIPVGSVVNVPFDIPEDASKLKYNEVISKFNQDHADITEHVFFKDLLYKIWEANGAALTSDTLSRDTASEDYLKHAEAAVAQWASALTASKRLLVIADLERELANTTDTEETSQPAPKKRKKGSKKVAKVMSDVQLKMQSEVGADKTKMTAVKQVRKNLLEKVKNGDEGKKRTRTKEGDEDGVKSSESEEKKRKIDYR